MYLVILVFIAVAVLGRAWAKRKNSLRKSSCTSKTFAFFHPHCASGGGGERVLWLMLAALVKNTTFTSQYHIVIYTSDQVPRLSTVLQSVSDKFKIDLSSDVAKHISLVPISTYTLLDGSRYPFLTMLCQSLGSMVVAIECLWLLVPDVLCDTTGAPFIYPIAKYFGGCTVLAYIHYPIISSDMLNRVIEQRPSYNNKNRIATSTRISALKVLYYRLFAYCFGLTGRCVDHAYVNGSWTEAHMKRMWSITKLRLIKLYPPCNTTLLQQLPLQPREKIVLSVGQFRPEKDHALQIRILRQLLNRQTDVKFVLLGSTRNIEDERLLQGLRDQAAATGVSDHVEFVVNASFATLQNYFQRSAIGLHTMWNEHFGISVVEMMASGMIVVAHNSGGPALDIISDNTGYLASTEEEYADCITQALNLSMSADLTMRRSARSSTDRYSDEVFEKQFIDDIINFLQKIK